MARLNKDAAVYLLSSHLATLLESLTQLHKSPPLFSVDPLTHQLRILWPFHSLCGYFSIQIWILIRGLARLWFLLKKTVLIELLQQGLMLHMIIMWQFCISILSFTNTRRHNNASGFICIKNMGVIVSTGKAEMSLIPNSMMGPYKNIFLKSVALPAGKQHGFYFDTLLMHWLVNFLFLLLNLIYSNSNFFTCKPNSVFLYLVSLTVQP